MSENNVYPKAAAGEQSANVAPNPSFPKLEESVLDYWEKDDTFQKSIERRPSGDHSQNEFVFFDGPPFANGLPHYGHLLTGYAKDVIPRYQTMKGHKVNRVFGWDTHGLPPSLKPRRNWASIRSIRSRNWVSTSSMMPAAPLRAQVHQRVEGLRAPSGTLGRFRAWLQDAEHSIHGIRDVGVQAAVRQGPRISGLPRAAVLSEGSDAAFRARAAHGRRRVSGSSGHHRVRGREAARRGRRLCGVLDHTPWTVPTNFAIVVGADIDYVEVRPTEGKFAGKKFYLGKPLLGSYAKGTRRQL